MIIVPDVHGRDFWRNPVEYALKNTNEKIVFLGDYVDPYPSEWQSPNNPWEFTCDYKQKAYDTLLEIINLKKDNMDRIILLLGNHDLGYIDKNICECRQDKKRILDIKNTINNNRELFKLAHEETINSKHYIFSHAGISKIYAKVLFPDANENNVVDMFNDAWSRNDQRLIGSLSIYDHYRGYGGYEFASLVWADLREWFDEKPRTGYGYQIVGHTQVHNPIISDNIAGLDCHKVFILTNDNKIEEYVYNKI